MINVVLGASGLVGTRLVEALLRSDETVLAVDRNSSSQYDYKRFSFLKADVVQDTSRVVEWIQGNLDDKSEVSVWHLAANSDIRSGIEDPFVDYKDTLGTTIAAIKISRATQAEFLGFSSSSAVYGDKSGKPANEQEDELSPISNYGLMKLFSEIIIEKFSKESPQLTCLTFRFPNVVGIPLTHGIVKDLFDKLSLRPKFVEVLGNGFQRKQYIHVSELVRLMILMRQGVQSNYEIFNIAPIDDGIFIKFIAESLRDLISPSTELKYGDTDYGWKGDVPRYFLDTSKLVREGFEVTINSEEAVRITLEEIESLLHD